MNQATTGVAKDVERMNDRLRGADGRFVAMGKAARGTGGSLKRMASGFATAAKAVAVLGAAVAAATVVLVAFKVVAAALTVSFRFLKDSIKLAAEMEQTTIAFNQFIKSAEKTNKVMAELIAFSASTPLETREVLRAGQALAGFGVEADQIIEKVRTLGEISSGISNLGLQELVLIFGKIRSLGRVTWEEINQLMLRTVPITAALAEVMGVAESEVKKLVIAGQVGFPQINAALTNLTRGTGTFAGSLKKQSESFTGLISTIISQWDLIKATVGKPLILALKPALDEVVSRLTALQTRAEELEPALQGIADRLVAAFLVIDEIITKNPEGLIAGLREAVDVFKVLFIDAIKIAGVLINQEFEQAAFKLGTAFRNLFADEGLYANLREGLRVSAAIFGNEMAAKLQGVLSGPLMTDLAKLAGFDVGKAKPFNAEAAFLGALAGREAPVRKPIEQVVAENTSQESVALLKRIADRAEQFERDRKAAAVVKPPEPFEKIFIAPGAGVPGAAGGGAGALQTRADTIKKSVQTMGSAFAELDKLFKAGLLTAGEFDRARAKVETRFTKRAVVTEAGKAAIALQERGRQVALAGRNPAEIFRDTKAELDILRAAGALTFDEFNRAVGIAKNTHASAMEAVADAQRRMVEASKSELEKLMDSWRDTARLIDRANVDIANSIANNITSGLVSIVDRTKTAGEAFADMATGIVNEITRIVIQMLVLRALGGLGGTFGGFFGAGVRHDGSSSGESRTRMVSPTVFAGARRFHRGGTVPGLRLDEEPAILQTGETVLSREDSIKMRTKLATDQSDETKDRGGRTTEITIVNVDDVNRIREMFATNPDLILNPINKQLPRIKRMILG